MIEERERNKRVGDIFTVIPFSVEGEFHTIKGSVMEMIEEIERGMGKIMQEE